MNKDKYTAKTIAETGIMFALIFLIVLLTANIPILSDIGVFILPIPITILYIKYDVKISLIAVIMSMILTAIFYDPISALVSAVTYGFVGVSLGYCIKNKMSSMLSTLITAVAAIISNIIKICIYILLMNAGGFIGYVKAIVEELKSALETSRQLYITSNASKEAIDLINEYINNITVKNVLILLPVVLILSSLIQAYINYYITEKTLRRLKYDVNESVPFSEIYIPNRFLALSIGIECLAIILNTKGVSGTTYVVKILQLIIYLVLTIDGISYTAYFLRNIIKLSKKASAFLIIIAIFMPVLSSIFVGIGLIDILFNMRKLDPNPIRIIKSRK